MSNKELIELTNRLLELARKELDYQKTFRDENGIYKDDDTSNMLFWKSSGRCEGYLHIIDILKDYEGE